MFRNLAQKIQSIPGAPPNAGFSAVVGMHPLQLHRYLEERWAAGFTPTAPGIPTPVPQEVIDAYRLPASLLASLPSGWSTALADNPTAWEHLIYSYLVENTGLIPIFRRVLELYDIGETLEVPGPETRHWLRATEELFFRDPPPFHISALTSSMRPDIEASRRNSYWRMFGMDLNHGGADGRPYPFVRTAAGNRDFVLQWEGFLQEVWQSYVNRKNSSGENVSDPEAVANKAEALSQVLRVRRIGGNLAREEYFFTAMLGWFHMVLEDDTPVVIDLKARAASPAERLRKIGERVGIAPHPKSRSFFEMAEPASIIVRAIEADIFSQPSGAGVLYEEPGGATRDEVLVIINHWSIATGRDLKLRRPDERPVRRPNARPPVQWPVTRQPPATAVVPFGRENEVSMNGHQV